jgi:hypothetical protein
MRDTDKQTLLIATWNVQPPSSGVNTSYLFDGWPAIKYYANSGLDLHFAPLLLCDEAIIDEESFDRIIHTRADYAARIANSFSVLSDRGFLKKIDFRNTLRSNASKIAVATNFELESVDKWVDVIRKDFEKWETNREIYKRGLGSSYDFTVRAPTGVLEALSVIGRKKSERNLSFMRRILFKHKHVRSSGETDILKEIVRPYLDYVHSYLLLWEKYKMPVSDWEENGNIFKRKLELGFKTDTAIQGSENLKTIFSVALSKLEPSNVQSFLRVVRDKRMKELRDVVQVCGQEGADFDYEFLQKIIIELGARRPRVGRANTIINAIGWAAGVIPTVLGAPMLTNLASGVAITGSQEVAARAADSIFDRKYQWILCLIEESIKNQKDAS